MPVESLIDADSLLLSPAKAGALSAIFFSIAVFLTILLNYGNGGMLLVTFTIIPAIPLFMNVFEKEESEIANQVDSLTVYPRSIKALFYYFLGIIFTCALWYFLLPETINQRVFSDQLNEIKAISANMTQWAVNDTVNYFEKIFFHNLSVMILILLFSLIYGAGALFILTWNASIIGVFVGQAIYRINATSIRIAEKYGFLSILHSIFYGLFISISSIAMHGFFELISYLATAAAGSIISVSITKKTYKKSYFAFVVSSFVKLMSVAVIALGIAAYIETKLITG